MVVHVRVLTDQQRVIFSHTIDIIRAKDIHIEAHLLGDLAEFHRGAFIRGRCLVLRIDQDGEIVRVMVFTSPIVALLGEVVRCVPFHIREVLLWNVVVGDGFHGTQFPLAALQLHETGA